MITIVTKVVNNIDFGESGWDMWVKRGLWKTPLFSEHGDNLGDSEASAPQSCLVYRSQRFYSNVKRERWKKPTVALACDKAAPTTLNILTTS